MEHRLGAFPNALPNLFVIGAAKSGTTSLYTFLSEHPEIFMPREKEPQFFINDMLYRQGTQSYIRRHFRGADTYRVRGEASPGYFHHPDIVIPRLAEVYGAHLHALRFVVVFRDPVARAWSHYRHCVRFAIEQETFERALELEENRLRDHPRRWVGYFKHGLYAQQLQAWLTEFDREQFCFLLTDDFRQPEQTKRDLFQFLSVNEDVPIDFSRRVNEYADPISMTVMRLITRRSKLRESVARLLGPYWVMKMAKLVGRLNAKRKPSGDRSTEWMSKETEITLRNRYQDDTRALSAMIGRDLSHWINSAAANDPHSPTPQSVG